jgi:hypothetical protein
VSHSYPVLEDVVEVYGTDNVKGELSLNVMDGHCLRPEDFLSNTGIKISCEEGQYYIDVIEYINKCVKVIQERCLREDLLSSRESDNYRGLKGVV